MCAEATKWENGAYLPDSRRAANLPRDGADGLHQVKHIIEKNVTSG